MKVVDKIKTHISLLVTFVFRKLCRLWQCGNIWYSRTGHGWQYNTTHVNFMLDTKGYRYTLEIFNNIYCFSMATMVTRTRLNVTLYAHCQRAHTVGNSLTTCNSLWWTLVRSECLLPSTKPSVPSPRSLHPGCTESKMWDRWTHARSEVIAEVLLRMGGRWDVTPCRLSSSRANEDVIFLLTSEHHTSKRSQSSSHLCNRLVCKIYLYRAYHTFLDKFWSVPHTSSYLYMPANIYFDLLEPKRVDLCAEDICLQGHLKTLAFSSPIENEETLHQRISYVCQSIRRRPMTFEMVWQSTCALLQVENIYRIWCEMWSINNNWTIITLENCTVTVLCQY